MFLVLAASMTLLTCAATVTRRKESPRRVNPLFIVRAQASRMILIVAAAILGAFVGLYVQPRLFALAIGLSVSGAAQLILVFVGRLVKGGASEKQVWAVLDYITFADVHGIWPVMAAAGTGTLLAAVAWSVLRKDSTDAFWLPSDHAAGRRNGLRSMDLVEDREVHSAARERLNAILRR